MRFKFLTLMLILFIAVSSCSETGTNDTRGNASIDEMFSKNPVDRLDERDLKSILNLPEDTKITKTAYPSGNAEVGMIEYKRLVNGENQKVSLSFVKDTNERPTWAKDRLNNSLKYGTILREKKITYESVNDKLGEGAIWCKATRELQWYKGNDYYTLAAKGNPAEGDLLRNMVKIASQF